MLKLIGKEFSLETNKVRETLEKLNVDYQYLDYELYEGDDLKNFVKMNKIKALPILIYGQDFVVTHDESFIRKFLEKMRKDAEHRCDD